MYKPKTELSDSDDSKNYYEKKSHRFSHSRSPLQRPNEFHKRRSKILSANEEMYKEKLELLADKKQLISDLKDAKKSIETLKSNLEHYKSSTLIFLPCSHHKIVNIKHKQLLDSTFEKALQKLQDDEKRNEILMRQLRSKIFYNIEARYPELFQCNQSEKFVNEKCGHKAIAECHEIKKFMKNSAYPPCVVKVECDFKCGHSEYFECNLRGKASCSQCN